MAASWDQQRFLASLGSMQALTEVFLQTFLQNLQQNVDKFELAQQQLDFQTIGRIAHSIKGSAGQVFCSKLAEMAAELEASTTDDMVQIELSIKALKQQAQLESDAIELFIRALKSG
jgi:HPt (histidine-containing phosphotransfer) domain-containing protein